MKKILNIILPAALIAVLCGCTLIQPQKSAKIRVIIDSDANNELDDQHAIAYTLFSGDAFDVEGVTVNRTRSGGPVAKHREEAVRVVKLCNLDKEIRVCTGADGSFDEIKDKVGNAVFDGCEAVNFIIERSHACQDRKLVLIPVGKLTNIALALKKDPSIASKIRIVWLGSNYPDPGEYNQDNDLASLNYVLNCNVPFEIALVRYGKSSGTDAVRASLKEIREKMPGLGPRITEPVTGRHGGEFFTFGDYSVNLFDKMGHESRALFDMAAVAVVKNPLWASTITIPAPVIDGKAWKERSDNPRRITLWENFNRDAIMADFYKTMQHPVLAR